MSTEKQETIRESTFGEPGRALQVDEEQHIIRGVKCLGRSSKNGRTYTDQALADAGRFYEGIGVNLDHPGDDDGPRGCRRMVDGFGVLRETRIETDGVFADLHYLESHPLSAVIVERAKRFPENLGLSHDAVGVVSESEDGIVVEALRDVHSVDIVQRPATTAGLFESEDRSETMPAKPKKKSMRESLEAHPKEKGAASLLLLLEEEEFAAAAEAPVEEEPDAKGAIKAALRKLVMQAFDDDSLDMAATLARIKKILQSQEKLTKQLGDEPGGEAAAAAEPALEAVTKRLDAIDRREGLRDLLESRGLHRSDLTAPQLRIFDRAASVEAAGELLESWEVVPLRESQRTKPAIGPATSTGNDNRSTDELLESVFGTK